MNFVWKTVEEKYPTMLFSESENFWGDRNSYGNLE